MLHTIGNDDVYVIMHPNSIEDYDIEKMGYADINRPLYFVNWDVTIQSVELSIE